MIATSNGACSFTLSPLKLEPLYRRSMKMACQPAPNCWTVGAHHLEAARLSRLRYAERRYSDA